MVKAVALLSGGLDSSLAAKLMLELGVELVAVNFRTVFCTCTPKGQSCLAAKHAVEQLGIPLKVFGVSEEYLAIVRSPRHGYGRNLNPCIDCRIFIFKKAGEYMREIGAGFLVTGEVLGQRPMSQRRHAMKIIDRESGLEGLILRPLSAGLLEPTIPERNGWVDREKLLKVKGRSRRPQIALAENYGLRDYPCPAGGCLLTDGNFANRMRDLMKHTPDFTLDDVKMLKLGRHFRLSPEVKLVVGRNETENAQICRLAVTGDTLFEPSEVPGPTSVLRGPAEEDLTALSAAITARYCDGSTSDPVGMTVRIVGGGGESTSDVTPAAPEEFEGLRVSSPLQSE